MFAHHLSDNLPNPPSAHDTPVGNDNSTGVFTIPIYAIIARRATDALKGVLGMRTIIVAANRTARWMGSGRIACISARAAGVVVRTVYVACGTGSKCELPIKDDAADALDENDESYEREQDSEHRLGDGGRMKPSILYVGCRVLEFGRLTGRVAAFISERK
jgi:hypothetical protein